jgi:asparagine synthase (glutamine-hydrolysing)
MCGILGVTDYVSIELFSHALNQISHRGPDDSGTWFDEGYITLGHRRLSIIDLSAKGHQPMTDFYEKYVIVFNGEIYNFLEIKSELKKRGYYFKTDSDTEVVLAAYIEWGPECQNHFNGMWALAIWDKNLKKLFLSRDRFGKKPLFYAELQNRQIVFASEMKGIFPFLKKVQPSEKINEQLLFLFDYEHTEDCVIEGIKRLEPGHCATYQNGTLKKWRWWNTLDHLPIPPGRYEEQVEIWRELFLDSVRLRLRSDVPVGTALSGGLDSSATFSAMFHIIRGSSGSYNEMGQSVSGFCAHYPGSDLDELKWAKLVAKSLNSPLNVVEINPTQAGWSITDALFQVEDPYLTLPLPMLATYKAISKSGIKVTLDGHGADELFSGYGHLLSALKSATPHQYAELIAIEESTSTGSFSANYEWKQINYLKARLMHQFNSLSRVPRGVAKALLGKIDWDYALYRLKFSDQVHPEYQKFDPLTKKMYEIFHISILPTLLRNYDRYSMASGVEIRMPFMDWRLVTFTFSLPWTSKVGNGYTKRIMRDALKEILPEEIRCRRDKVGWNAPLHEWLKGDLRVEVENLIQGYPFSNQLRDEWRKFQRCPKPSFIDGQKMWAKLLPFLWKNQFNG